LGKVTEGVVIRLRQVVDK